MIEVRIRRFQLHLSETGASICNRNRIMTGLRFLFRVTLRRLDLAAEIYHLREPQKIPLVMSQDETRRLTAPYRSGPSRNWIKVGINDCAWTDAIGGLQFGTCIRRGDSERCTSVAAR